MNKKIVLVILVIISFFLLNRGFKPGQSNPSSSSNNQTENQLNLPTGWQKVTSPSGTSLKFEKTVTSGLKPEIVVINTTSTDATNPTKYTNTLVSGARSTLPSLRFITDVPRNSDGLYTRFLAGFYYNQKNKVDLVQRIYITGEKVTILTASYDVKTTPTSEIDSIFDTLWSQP